MGKNWQGDITAGRIGLKKENAVYMMLILFRLYASSKIVKWHTEKKSFQFLERNRRNVFFLQKYFLDFFVLRISLFEHP